MKTLYISVTFVLIAVVLAVVTLQSANQRIKKQDMEKSIDHSVTTALNESIELGTYRLSNHIVIQKERAIEVLLSEFAKQYELNQDVDIHYFIKEDPALIMVYAQVGDVTYSETYIIEEV